ncbi:50S ribosomal protein L4 [Microbacterium sp.]|uniref:50S ribosomal protein L4 n=1 Tax=Microbacterium sp. TaxID=51671 RepID=UPI003A8EBD20
MADSTLALDVLAVDGKKAGSIELPAAIFDVKTNIPLIHQVVVAQLAAARQGTHSTKRRGEVSGAGRKPFKQKGTGNARQGSIRAPHMTGGGIVHGPKPRDYSQRTPKKMIAAALLGVLSDRFRGERCTQSRRSSPTAPSTKTARACSPPSPVRRTCSSSSSARELTVKSVRNLPNVHVLSFDQLNAYDVSSPTTSSSPSPHSRLHRLEDRPTEEVSA